MLALERILFSLLLAASVLFTHPVHHTAAQTATPPQVSATPTNTPEQQMVLYVYGTVSFLKGAQVVLDETAIGVMSGTVTGPQAFGTFLVAGIILSQTRANLANPAPFPEIKSAWSSLQGASMSLSRLLSDWWDNKISAKEVLAETPKLQKRIDAAELVIRRAIAKRYKIRQVDLLKMYDRLSSDLRKSIADTK